MSKTIGQIMCSKICYHSLMDKNFDALVVLGKNIGVGWTRKRIKKTKNFLSTRSELNITVAALLYKKGNFKKLILSGGRTSGKDVPSEAEAMKKFLSNEFPEIPTNSIILEENSLDTKQNASETEKNIKKYELKNVAVLTTSAHVPRTRMHFKRQGLNLEILASDKILQKLSPETYEKYKKDINLLELLFEKAAIIFQSIPVINSFTDFLIEKRRFRD